MSILRLRPATSRKRRGGVRIFEGHAGRRRRRPTACRAATKTINGMLRVPVGFTGTDTHGLKAFVASAAAHRAALYGGKRPFASELGHPRRAGRPPRARDPVRIAEKRLPRSTWWRVPNVLKNLAILTYNIRLLRASWAPKMSESDRSVKARPLPTKRSVRVAKSWIASARRLSAVGPARGQRDDARAHHQAVPRRLFQPDLSRRLRRQAVRAPSSAIWFAGQDGARHGPRIPASRPRCTRSIPRARGRLALRR